MQRRNSRRKRIRKTRKLKGPTPLFSQIEGLHLFNPKTEDKGKPQISRGDRIRSGVPVVEDLEKVDRRASISRAFPRESVGWYSAAGAVREGGRPTHRREHSLVA